MEFGINLDQTAVDFRHEMVWNFQQSPCNIFYRDKMRICVLTESFKNGAQNKLCLNFPLISRGSSGRSIQALWEDYEND